MNIELNNIKTGLALVLLSLAFGLAMGVSFHVYEDSYKSNIAAGIETNPAVHDAKSADKIWRYAQRAHFHATGISSFALGLVILTLFTSMNASMKKLASTLVGLSGSYALAWYSMYMLAPSIGRAAAHEHILTQVFTFIGVGGLLLGFALIVGNIFFGLFRAR